MKYKNVFEMKISFLINNIDSLKFYGIAKFSTSWYKNKNYVQLIN